MAKENSVSIKITPEDMAKITDSLIIVEETLAKYTGTVVNPDTSGKWFVE